MGENPRMLLDGINHVAVMTSQTDVLVAFYREVFDAEVIAEPVNDDQMRLTLIQVGPHSELNLFELKGNDEPTRQTPMFGRGRLDHLGLQAADMASFETLRDRLVERGCTDGFVTDFGMYLSLFWTDPEGLECELLVTSPDGVHGVIHPPGTPARRFHPA
jgi:catechol 2,3-dioxygenase-like lactoylglutathione lyase family enzyme